MDKLLTINIQSSYLHHRKCMLIVVSVCYLTGMANPCLLGSEIELVEAIPKEELEKHHFPIDTKFRGAWISFYISSSEVDNISALVEGGPEIAPSVSAAVKDKKLFKRRYAILALGYLKNQIAIDVLNQILTDKSEEDIFRSDALYSLFRISVPDGVKCAKMLLVDSHKFGVGPITLNSAKEVIERPHDVEMTWQVRRGP